MKNIIHTNKIAHYYMHNGFDSLISKYQYYEMCANYSCNNLSNYIYLYLDKRDSINILTFCSNECIMNYHSNFAHKIFNKYETPIKDPVKFIEFLKKAALLR